MLQRQIEISQRVRIQLKSYASKSCCLCKSVWNFVSAIGWLGLAMNKSYSITKICLIWFWFGSRQPTRNPKKNTHTQRLLLIAKLLFIIWFIHYAAFLRMIFHLSGWLLQKKYTRSAIFALHRWIFFSCFIRTNGDMAISDGIIQDNGFFLSIWMNGKITEANSDRHNIGGIPVNLGLSANRLWWYTSKTYINGKEK